MKALCRFHHILKTHTDWLDDQSAGQDGRTTTVVITPEGRVYSGPAWTGEDLFPALRKLVWNNTAPTPTPTPPPQKPVNPNRTRPRTQAKHRRRQQERARNRLRRESADDAGAG
jgi:hypothetical protein